MFTPEQCTALCLVPCHNALICHVTLPVLFFLSHFPFIPFPMPMSHSHVYVPLLCPILMPNVPFSMPMCMSCLVQIHVMAFYPLYNTGHKDCCDKIIAPNIEEVVKAIYQLMMSYVQFVGQTRLLDVLIDSGLPCVHVFISPALKSIHMSLCACMLILCNRGKWAGRCVLKEVSTKWRVEEMG